MIDIDSIRIEFFEETLKREGLMNLSTIGTSMFPVVCPGDVVIVVPCSMDEIHTNDIVILKKDGVLITHRVYKVEINEAQHDHSIIYTKGDNNLMPDSPMPVNTVIAKVVGYKKKSVYHFVPRFFWEPVGQFFHFLHRWLTRAHERVHTKAFYKRLIILKNRSFFRKFNNQSIKKLLYNLSHMQITSHKKADDSL